MLNVNKHRNFQSESSSLNSADAQAAAWSTNTDPAAASHVGNELNPLTRYFFNVPEECTQQPITSHMDGRVYAPPVAATNGIQTPYAPFHVKHSLIYFIYFM